MIARHENTVTKLTTNESGQPAAHLGQLLACSRYDIASYEAKKTAWIARNPDSTPGEYQFVMRAIAAACGV